MNGKNKGSSGGGKYLTPKPYITSKGYKGMYSRPNNDGNLWTRRSPWKKPGYNSPCYITEAATSGAGLGDDCYELAVLRMFREEYVAALPDGEAILADYREKAPRVIEAIGELPAEDSHKVWECLYTAGIIPSVLLITRGWWDEAYSLYRSMCEEVEEIFLEGNLSGYDPDTYLDDWVEAKLAQTPLKARELAGRGGVIPPEVFRAERWRLERSLGPYSRSPA